MNEMKFPDNTVFGLDIGTRSVVGTVGYMKPTGEFVILSQKTECHETRAMLDGQIHDIDKVTETVQKVKTELETELGRELKTVCIAAAGRVLKTINIRVEYDLGEENTVNEEMLHNLEMLGMEQAKEKVHSESDDDTEYFCVGYSIVRYYLGSVQLTNLIGHHGKKIAADFLATFLPKDVIDGLYTVCERVKLNVLSLTLEPIAAINIAIPEKFRLLNLALVDIGAGTSDICITKEGTITGYGMLPCAGDFLTESIMYELLTDFPTAENIKLAYAKKRKKMQYRDVMGSRQVIEATKVKEILESPFRKLTASISDKIKELNGGDKVGAVFIVGGGGKNAEFTEMLAEAMGLPKTRVVLRGKEVFTTVTTQEGKSVKDPMLVTPIGICMNYYKNNNNFITLTINGVEIKLYDNGNLNVMDAIVSYGMSNAGIFPKRGADLKYTVNGAERVARGKNGDSSVIIINNEESSVTAPIASGDDIVVKESTVGEKGHIKISEIPEYKEGIFFIINGKQSQFERKVKVNGEEKQADYDVKEGDSVEIADYYTLSELFTILDVSEQFKVTVNNKEIDMSSYDKDEKVFGNYIIDVTSAPVSVSRPAAAPTEPEVKAVPHMPSFMNQKKTDEITVTVNKTQVTLKGKTSYTFVDILDFYTFNITAATGNKLITKVNGKEADFFTAIKEGDVAELYWEKI